MEGLPWSNAALSHSINQNLRSSPIIRETTTALRPFDKGTISCTESLLFLLLRRCLINFCSCPPSPRRCRSALLIQRVISLLLGGWSGRSGSGFEVCKDLRLDLIEVLLGLPVQESSRLVEVSEGRLSRERCCCRCCF
jgi:hypothetical protein